MSEYLLAIYAFATDETGNSFLYNYPQYLSPTETLIVQNHTGLNPQFTNSPHPLNLTSPGPDVPDDLFQYLNNQAAGRIQQYEEQQQLLSFFEELLRPFIPTQFLVPNQPHHHSIPHHPVNPQSIPPSQPSQHSPQQTTTASTPIPPVALTPTGFLDPARHEPTLTRSETTPPLHNEAFCGGDKPKLPNLLDTSSDISKPPSTPTSGALSSKSASFRPPTHNTQSNGTFSGLYDFVDNLDSDRSDAKSAKNDPRSAHLPPPSPNTLQHQSHKLNAQHDQSQPVLPSSMQTIILSTGEIVSIPAAPGSKSETTAPQPTTMPTSAVFGDGKMQLRETSFDDSVNPHQPNTISLHPIQHLRTRSGQSNHTSPLHITSPSVHGHNAHPTLVHTESDSTLLPQPLQIITSAPSQISSSPPRHSPSAALVVLPKSASTTAFPASAMKNENFTQHRQQFETSLSPSESLPFQQQNQPDQQQEQSRQDQQQLQDPNSTSTTSSISAPSVPTSTLRNTSFPFSSAQPGQLASQPANTIITTTTTTTTTPSVNPLTSTNQTQTRPTTTLTQPKPIAIATTSLPPAVVAPTAPFFRTLPSVIPFSNPFSQTFLPANSSPKEHLFATPSQPIPFTPATQPISSAPLSSVGLLQGNYTISSNNEITTAQLPSKTPLFLSLTNRDAIKRIVCTHSLVGRILHASLDDGVHIIATPTQLPKHHLARPQLHPAQHTAPPTPSLATGNGSINDDGSSNLDHTSRHDTGDEGETTPQVQQQSQEEESQKSPPTETNTSFCERLPLNIPLAPSEPQDDPDRAIPEPPQLRQLGIAARLFQPNPPQYNAPQEPNHAPPQQNPALIASSSSSSAAAATAALSTTVNTEQSSNILALTFALAPHTPPDIIHKFTTLSILFTAQLSDILTTGPPDTVFQPLSTTSSHKTVLTHLDQFHLLPSGVNASTLYSSTLTDQSGTNHITNHHHHHNSPFWSNHGESGMIEDVIQIPRVREIITSQLWDYFNTQIEESMLIQFTNILFSFSPSNSHHSVTTAPSLLTELIQKQPIYHHIIQHFLVSYITAHILSVYSTTCQAIKLLFHQVMMFNQVNLYHNNRQLLFSFLSSNDSPAATPSFIQHSRYFLPYCPTVFKFAQFHTMQYRQQQYQFQLQEYHRQEQLRQTFSLQSKFNMMYPSSHFPPQRHEPNLDQFSIRAHILDQLTTTTPSLATINEYYQYHLTIVHPILRSPSKYSILLLFPQHILLDTLSTLQHSLLLTAHARHHGYQPSTSSSSTTPFCPSTTPFCPLNALHGSTQVSISVLFSTVVNRLTLLNPFTPVGSISSSIGYYTTLYFLITQHLAKIIPVITPTTVLRISPRFFLSEDLTNVDPQTILHQHHNTHNHHAGPATNRPIHANSDRTRDCEYHIPLSFLNPRSIQVQQALEHWQRYKSNQLQDEMVQVVESFTQTLAFSDGGSLQHILPPVQQLFAPLSNASSSTSSEPLTTHEQIQQNPCTNARNQPGAQFQQMAQDISFQGLSDFTSNESAITLFAKYTESDINNDNIVPASPTISQHHLAMMTSALQIASDFSIAQQLHKFPAGNLYDFLLLLQCGRSVSQLLDILHHEAQNCAEAEFLQASQPFRDQSEYDHGDEGDNYDGHYHSQAHCSSAGIESPEVETHNQNQPSSINTAVFASGFIQLVQYCLIHNYIAFIHPTTRYLLPALSQHEHTVQLHPDTCDDCQFLYGTTPLEQRLLYRLAFPLRPFSSSTPSTPSTSPTLQPHHHSNQLADALFDQECINYLYQQQYGHGYSPQHLTPEEINILEEAKARLGDDMFVDLNLGI